PGKERPRMPKGQQDERGEHRCGRDGPRPPPGEPLAQGAGVGPLQEAEGLGALPWGARAVKTCGGSFGKPGSDGGDRPWSGRRLARAVVFAPAFPAGIGGRDNGEGHGQRKGERGADGKAHIFEELAGEVLY